MTTITVPATRITDIDATIARLKMASRFMDDSTARAMMTDRMADLIIERQALLDAKVSKTVAKPEAAKSAAKPAPAKASKPAKAAAKPIAPEAGVNAEPSIAAGKPSSRRTLSGKVMPTGKGTITKGQKAALVKMGFDGRKLRYMSMADASDLRFNAKNA